MKSWRTLLGLALVLAGALWLRWRYIQEISLYVDEFTTIWAANRVQELGAPLMPSGVLYTRGLLASYVEAGFLALLGQSYTVARLPSLIFGLATIVVIWWIGRREWAWPVGWLAALGLALLPEAIIWSGRARFYAQLQFLVLLLVWAAYAAATDPATGDRKIARRQWTFAILFILALFSQEETLLLYPTLLLGFVLWRGWRYLLRTPVWSAQLVCLLAIALRYLVETWGQPGYFETIQEQRPYVGLVLDLPGAWATYSPLLTGWERLPWTLAVLLALGVALLALGKLGWRPTALSRFDQTTLFFSLQFLAVLALILTLVGTTWRESRYLFLVQPLWLLLGAAGLTWLIQRIASPHWRTLAVAGACLLLLIGWWRPAQEVLARQVEGYDLALDYLRESYEEGDVVMSPQPPACALALGPCDYYAVQRGYEEFVIPRDGVLVDRWSGAALLNTTEQLEAVIREAPAVWFLTDSFRLATRYDADFVRTVVEQFDPVFAERGILVLKAEGWRSQPDVERQAVIDPPALLPPLALAGWQRSPALPGETMQVTLFWQGDSPISDQYNTSLQLVAADGSRITQDDGPPARGMIPTTLFFDAPVPDIKRLALPVDLAPGRYRLEVSVYDAATATPVAEPLAIDWFRIGPAPAPPEIALDVGWENGLHLAGWDGLVATARAGDTVNVRLLWQAEEAIDDDLTAFVHLVGDDGQPVAQSDRPPQDGFYPTRAWQVGDPVEESYALEIPAGQAAGELRLLIGWYDPKTGVRSILLDGSQALELAEVLVIE